MHTSLFLVRFPAKGEAASATEIDLVSITEDAAADTGEDGEGDGPSAGPPAARQDLPPQRAPEPQTPSLPLPPGTIPLALPAAPADQMQQLPAPAPVAPEVVFNPDAPYATEQDEAGGKNPDAQHVSENALEGAGTGPSTIAGTASAPGAGYSYARIPSGGAPGGVGLPGGGTSLGGSGGSGSGRGGGRSSGRASASSEKRFIPYYKVDRPPKIVSNATLEYPVLAKRKNLEATVVLEADIDEKGKVEAVRVVKPAGFGFDEAAEKYIKESAFSPAYIGDTPVAVLMRISIQFSLSD